MKSDGGQREYWSKMILMGMHNKGLVVRADWGRVNTRLMRKKIADLKQLLKRFG